MFYGSESKVKTMVHGLRPLALRRQAAKKLLLLSESCVPGWHELVKPLAKRQRLSFATLRGHYTGRFSQWQTPLPLDNDLP